MQEGQSLAELQNALLDLVNKVSIDKAAQHRACKPPLHQVRPEAKSETQELKVVTMIVMARWQM